MVFFQESNIIHKEFEGRPLETPKETKRNVTECKKINILLSNFQKTIVVV